MARDPAAHAPLDNPGGVASLLDSLRRAGADDQATDLVDTNTLRSQGFDVGEVAGSCFCCNFNGLVGTIEKLGHERRPDVILADEPTSALDPHWRQVVLDLLVAEARRGVAVVLASSDDEVTVICDELVTLGDDPA